ncbi:MAG: SDR family oxidoreductase [bacterium]|nr:SDR family oxidoreductase [bacterium]
MNILVTGASRGIGKAICKELSEGNSVFATARNEQLLSDYKHYCVCDLAEERGIEILSEYIENNKIDVLVNNAGEYFYSPIEQVRTDKLEHIIKLNLTVPLRLISIAVPYMKNNHFGRIINIGSISGVMGEACASSYSATKAGLIGATKALGLELAEYGITVNTINPGWVDTEMGNSSANNDSFTKDEIVDCIPQKRFVEPSEIASLVKYLISDKAKGITGQSINLCAGLSVGY